MRTTTYVSLLAVAALVVSAGCVKDVDAPAFSGPSTFANSILMVADRDTLTQNGVDFTDIKITALGPDGQSIAIPLRAQTYVNGIPADYGTLSTKSPLTPTTLRYTAPAASTLAAGQVAQTVTIVVTPTNAGDFRGEFSRQLDIRLQPQGIILPINPNLIANFTISPEQPKVMDVVTFDASTTTNNGVACGAACTYVWNFGDGTSATGQVTSHQYRTVGTFQASLTATDTLGANSIKVAAISVGAGAPPTAAFTVSPSNPGVNQDVFFNASQSTAVSPRTIASYNWLFGDGDTGTGVIVSKKYTAPGVYKVQLTTTDDAGTVSTPTTQDLTVGPTVGPTPTASLVATGSPSASKGTPAFFNASGSLPGSGANIVDYAFNFGDGEPVFHTTNPIQSHQYLAAGTFTTTVTVTDSLGRTATAQANVTVAP